MTTADDDIRMLKTSNESAILPLYFCSSEFRYVCSFHDLGLHYIVLFELLKIQIVCKYSTDMGNNANKLHFQCIDFNSSPRVTVYGECIYVFFKIKILSSSLNAMLIVEKHCML